MSEQTCGCATSTCGCCEGARVLTPVRPSNRPGLPTLAFRAGVHGSFFETMKARLATVEVVAPGADRQTLETFRPLAGLTTRDAVDPSIALLDGWASVADVLTFYQERIANEGFLRTATERRSVLELARLVGYTLRPGVAASVYLAYSLEDKQLEPIEIPAGSAAQSVPGQDELPKAFETAEKLVARTEWNSLRVRRSRPQNVTLATGLSVETLYLAGTTTNLKPGDLLLLAFSAGAASIVRTVAKIDPDFAAGRTSVHLQPTDSAVLAATPALAKLVTRMGDPAEFPAGAQQRLAQRAAELLDAAYHGVATDPTGWIEDLRIAADEDLPAPTDAQFRDFVEEMKAAVGGSSGSPIRVVTAPSKFVGLLLKPRIPQIRNGLRLGRDLSRTFAPGSDALAQLVVDFAPDLRDTYYAAWASADVNATPPALDAVYALRATASLFGATVSRQPDYFVTDDLQGNPAHKAGQLKPLGDWTEWTLAADEAADAVFLDLPHPSILPSSTVLVQTLTSDGPRRSVRKVVASDTSPRTAYGVSGNTTRLTLDSAWWSGVQDSMATLRSTLVYGESEPLALVDEPITTSVGGSRIELDRLYDGLPSGRFVVVSGERADLPGVSGVRASELAVITAAENGFDASLPGDKTHTTLALATSLAFEYRRDTLSIFANVVRATNGATCRETLGSGDGSQELQTFDLKQPPVTYVSASSVTGTASTLHVFVNDVEWHEADTLAGLGPRDRAFVTKTDDDGKTSATFGTGEAGARVPSGTLNVRSVYRSGIGKAGNVRAGQVSLLQSRPLGVREVVNPLRASGGADAESRDLARANAPLAVASLDRLVSVQDYADFSRTFAGVGKADARKLSDGRRQLVHVTVAGVDDAPIDPTSDLYRNLVEALEQFGDAGVAVRVDARELVALVASVRIRVMPDFQWEPVVTELRSAILAEFGFDRRALGQPALLCELVAVAQRVRGVAYVDVESFGGVAETRTDALGVRRLVGLDEISDAVAAIVGGEGGPAAPAARVDAALAKATAGAIAPAQLAVFTPDVPGTLVVNQIS